MTKRIERVQELLKREVSQIILKEIDFPEDILVTVTRVEASANLQEARVYISCFPEKHMIRTTETLDAFVYEIQQKINKRLKMRPVPHISFVAEKKTAEAGKIEEALEKIKKERSKN